MECCLFLWALPRIVSYILLLYLYLVVIGQPKNLSVPLLGLYIAEARKGNRLRSRILSILISHVAFLQNKSVFFFSLCCLGGTTRSWSQPSGQSLLTNHPTRYGSKENIQKNCEDINDVLTTRSRTGVIYSLKELVHFLSKLLVDFVHVHYNDFIPYYHHSKTRTINRINLNTAHTHNIEYSSEINMSKNLPANGFYTHILSTITIVQGDPDLETFQSLYFHFRESTLSDLAPSLAICLYIYITKCTPPPPSLPSTILSSKQGEKWTLRLMIIHPSKRVDQPR